MKISGDQLFNPWKRQREPLALAKSVREVTQYATALIVEVFTKNKAINKSNPFLVCAINREKDSIHRWFNLSMTVDAHNIHPRQHGSQEYSGALSLAESLLDGSWYIASPEEEAACVAKDAKDREIALAQNTKDKMGEANNFFSGIMQAARMQQAAEVANVPQAVVASGHDNKRKTA